MFGRVWELVGGWEDSLHCIHCLKRAHTHTLARVCTHTYIHPWTHPPIPRSCLTHTQLLTFSLSSRILNSYFLPHHNPYVDKSQPQRDRWSICGSRTSVCVTCLCIWECTDLDVCTLLRTCVGISENTCTYVPMWVGGGTYISGHVYVFANLRWSIWIFRTCVYLCVYIRWSNTRISNNCCSTNELSSFRTRSPS